MVIMLMTVLLLLLHFKKRKKYYDDYVMWIAMLTVAKKICAEGHAGYNGTTVARWHKDIVYHDAGHTEQDVADNYDNRQVQ